MKSNQCPVCDQTAMSLQAKLCGITLECRHCHSLLRLRMKPTLAVALLVYIAVMLEGFYNGLNSVTLLFAVVCFLTFLAVCIFMPLELSNKNPSP
jgi:hypothetical protein